MSTFHILNDINAMQRYGNIIWLTDKKTSYLTRDRVYKFNCKGSAILTETNPPTRDGKHAVSAVNIFIKLLEAV